MLSSTQIGIHLPLSTSTSTIEVRTAEVLEPKRQATQTLERLHLL